MTTTELSVSVAHSKAWKGKKSGLSQKASTKRKKTDKLDSGYTGRMTTMVEVLTYNLALKDGIIVRSILLSKCASFEPRTAMKMLSIHTGQSGRINRYFFLIRLEMSLSAEISTPGMKASINFNQVALILHLTRKNTLPNT